MSTRIALGVGTTMPAQHILLHFQEDLLLEYQWDLSGSHYQKTAEAWLANMDQHRHEIREVFINTYGKKTGRYLATTLAHFLYGLCRVVRL